MYEEVRRSMATSVEFTKEYFNDLDDKSISKDFIISNEADLPLVKRLLDKRIYVLYCWYRDNPTSTIVNWQDFVVLVNINKQVQAWYKNALNDFATYSESPDWLVGDKELQDAWDAKFQSLNVNYKIKLVEFDEKRDRLYASIQDDLNEITKLQTDYEKAFYRENPVLLINRITVQSLPWSVVEQYSSMTPNARKKNLVKELVNFKRTLFKQYLNKEISFDDLLEFVK
jgi:hypothetical protein